MKKISLLIITVLLAGMFSCENQAWKFDDFIYTTTYFPYQYPVRTLVLGDYMFDNENDNNLKFKISVRIGGVYENKEDRTVGYQLEPGLATKLITNANTFDGKVIASSDTLQILPSQYYTLSPANQIVVPKGEFIGGIEVQLTDAFLDDPKAVLTRYVIPIRITTSTTDSVLVGSTTYTSPDPRIASNWKIVPKDFTIFAIKYVNAYHGKYLVRGRSVITDNIPTVLETIIYHKKYVENDELWSLQTVGRNKVRITNVLKKTPESPGSYSMDLAFDADNNCIVTDAPDSDFPVTGTGKFVKDGDMWGNEPKNAIYLNYIVTEGINTHTINDTLVFRDKAVIFQDYLPEILP
jgi:hypothetical protein